jgi:5-methylcytosine-specific restriction endonuclease McrA
MIKQHCEHCDKPYLPVSNNQKYCSRNCKDKAAWKRNKESGHIRSFKGGYPRAVVIKKWLDAQKQDEGTVGCRYCGTRVTPENFQLDHMKPLAKLKKSQVKLASNLIICCENCNREKGSRYTYEEFLAIKQK